MSLASNLLDINLRGYDMRHHDYEKPLSESSIARVFETLDLATQARRDDILRWELAPEPNQQAEAEYVINLSNSSKPIRGLAENAELERPSRRD